MGDIVSFVEKAQEQFTEEEARKMQKRILKNQINFNDFLQQLQQLKKMGNIKDLASMIPGMGKMLKNVEFSDDSFKGAEAIIRSMTPAEREQPDILNASRRKRVAMGSGTSVQQVNRLIKHFEDSKKVMRNAAKNNGKLTQVRR
jgi:signal recognition particle subunit SRP54